MTMDNATAEVVFDLGFMLEFYGEQYGKWTREHVTDDRRSFCEVYEKMVEALNIMRGIDNSVIWNGIRTQFDKQCHYLNSIKARFE